jgi:hypothetical protein
MIGRNHILETEIIEKTILRTSPFAHHGKTPSLKAIKQQNHDRPVSSNDFFNTLGYIRTWTVAPAASALPLTADIRASDFRYWG